MGLDDLIGKAKDALGGSDGVNEKIDAVAEAVKDKTPDNIDGHVDTAANAAKNFLADK